MRIFTAQTLTIVLHILGFAWSAPENTTVPGILTKTPEPRIIGGRNATRNEFPHHVLVFTEITNEGNIERVECGGSIIEQNYVLTAAHCVYEMDIAKIQVWAGIFRTTPPDSTLQISRAEKVFIHGCFPSGTEGDLRNDIAIVKLSRPLKFSEFVRPIKIDDMDRAKEGVKGVTAIGWGRTKDGDENSHSNQLKKAQLNIISEQECKKTFLGPYLDYTAHVCAGNRFEYICQGDSGGPLICLDSNTTYVCGIASFVPGVGCSYGPSAYTRVSRFKDWIYGVVENGSDSTLGCVGEGRARGRGSVIAKNGFYYGVVILILLRYLLR